jgi:hypothetical protein
LLVDYRFDVSLDATNPLESSPAGWDVNRSPTRRSVSISQVRHSFHPLSVRKEKMENITSPKQTRKTTFFDDPRNELVVQVFSKLPGDMCPTSEEYMELT